MRKLNPSEFVCEAVCRNFTGGLPLSDEIVSMFTYLEQNYDPKKILEIGFEYGGSATWFMETFPNATLVSIAPEIKKLDENNSCSELLKRKYPERFSFIKKQSWWAIQHQRARLKDEIGVFDLAFIDGDHSTGGVVNDIESVLKLRIPTILIDNMEVPDQQRAVSYYEKNLQFVKQFDYTPKKTTTYQKRYCRLYHVISYDF